MTNENWTISASRHSLKVAETIALTTLKMGIKTRFDDLEMAIGEDGKYEITCRIAALNLMLESNEHSLLTLFFSI